MEPLNVGTMEHSIMINDTRNDKWPIQELQFRRHIQSQITHCPMTFKHAIHIGQRWGYSNNSDKIGNQNITVCMYGVILVQYTVQIYGNPMSLYEKYTYVIGHKILYYATRYMSQRVWNTEHNGRDILSMFALCFQCICWN